MGNIETYKPANFIKHKHLIFEECPMYLPIYCIFIYHLIHNTICSSKPQKLTIYFSLPIAIQIMQINK